MEVLSHPGLNKELISSQLDLLLGSSALYLVLEVPDIKPKLKKRAVGGPEGRSSQSINQKLFRDTHVCSPAVM